MGAPRFVPPRRPNSLQRPRGAASRLLCRHILSRKAFRELDLDLSSREVRSAASEWFDRGDNSDEPSPWFTAGLHGRGWQRTSVFSVGFFSRSLRLCERLQTFGGRDTGRVGPYPVAVQRGSDIETFDRAHIRVTSDRGEAEVRYLETKPRTSIIEAHQLYGQLATKGDSNIRYARRRASLRCR